MDNTLRAARDAAAKVFIASFEPLIEKATPSLDAAEVDALRRAIGLWTMAMLESSDAACDSSRWFAGFGEEPAEREMLLLLFQTRNAFIPEPLRPFSERVILALEARILQLTSYKPQ